MKKTKVLIATLALSAALMGTGYAYWTQSIKVESNVSTAKFEVVLEGTFDCDGKYVYTGTEGTTLYETPVYTEIDNTKKLPQDQDGAKAYIKGLDQVENPTATIGTTGNLDIKVGNLFPGTAVVMKATVKNNSTIPVYGTLGENYEAAFAEFPELTCELYSTNPIDDGAIDSDAKYSNTRQILIKENSTTDVFVLIRMPASIGNDDDGPLYADSQTPYKGTVEITWHQFNENLPTES